MSGVRSARLLSTFAALLLAAGALVQTTRPQDQPPAPRASEGRASAEPRAPDVQQQNFKPTEKIKADSSVAFPVDI